MKIIKVSASFSTKKQIRQYEPVEVFMAAEAEVAETDDLAACQTELFNLVKTAAEAEMTKVLTSGA